MHLFFPQPDDLPGFVDHRSGKYAFQIDAFDPHCALSELKKVSDLCAHRLTWWKCALCRFPLGNRWKQPLSILERSPETQNVRLARISIVIYCPGSSLGTAALCWISPRIAPMDLPMRSNSVSDLHPGLIPSAPQRVAGNLPPELSPPSSKSAVEWSLRRCANRFQRSLVSSKSRSMPLPKRAPPLRRLCDFHGCSTPAAADRIGLEGRSTHTSGQSARR